jgi:hypothetical protein
MEQAFTAIVNNAVRRTGATRLPDSEGLGFTTRAGERFSFEDFFAPAVNRRFNQGGIAGIDAIMQIVRQLNNLLGFAEGGVVPGPMGAPRLAVVHGGETVIPANKGARGVSTFIFMGQCTGCMTSSRRWQGRSEN